MGGERGDKTASETERNDGRMIGKRGETERAKYFEGERERREKRREKEEEGRRDSINATATQLTPRGRRDDDAKRGAQGK